MSAIIGRKLQLEPPPIAVESWAWWPNTAKRAARPVSRLLVESTKLEETEEQADETYNPTQCLLA